MADYLELMERYNPDGKTAMLGMQGLSALLLFATAANECGAELTPDVPAREGRGPRRLDRRRAALAARPRATSSPPVQPRHPGRPRRLRLRRGAHPAQRGHLQLRSRQRRRARPTTTACRGPRPDGRSSAMDQFLQATITGLAPPPSWPWPPAASSSPTPPRASSTSPTAPSACSAPSPTGSSASAGAGRHPSPLVVVLGVLAPLLGVVIERVVMRGLYDAPRDQSQLVVSIGLLAALLGLGLLGLAPGRARPVRPVLRGDESVSVLGVNITWHDLIAFVVAIGLAVGLRVLLYRTRPGMAMRAAVDDRPSPCSTAPGPTARPCSPGRSAAPRRAGRHPHGADRRPLAT